MSNVVVNKSQNRGSYRWLVFSVTAIGTFMSTLDSSILNVALPIIAADFAVDLTTVQWAVTAYLLTISSLLPSLGRAGDIYGRRGIYSTGFVVFTLGSVLCGAAGDILLLVAFRIVQAVGAAMMMANAQAIVTATFIGSDRGRALGLTGTIVALGSLTGPGLGGLLIAAFGWRTIFYVNLPIGILGFIVGQRYLPPNQPTEREKFDVWGAVLFTAAMAAFLLVLNEGKDWGWLSLRTLIGTIFTVAAFSVFWRWESKIEQPMLDLTLFRHWPFLVGNLSGLLSFMAMFCNLILLPFYLHSILKLSAAQIGLIMTASPIVMAIVAPVSGYLSERVNAAILTTIGLVIMTGGLLYHVAFDQYTTIGQVALGQAVMGLGNGMFQSPNNNSVMSSVAAHKLGIAGGINALVRNVGMVSGIAVSVSVFEQQRRAFLELIAVPSEVQLVAAFLTAYHGALIVGAFFAGSGAIVSSLRRTHVKAATEK